MFSRLLRLLTSPLRFFDVSGAGRRIGTCGGCGTTVYEEDRHVKYRGEVFHVEPCVEISPAGTAGLRDKL